jgi:hypothetical protein
MRTTPASRSTAPIARGRVTWVHRESEEAEMVERKRTDQLSGYQERENCRRAARCGEAVQCRARNLAASRSVQRIWRQPTVQSLALSRGKATNLAFASTTARVNGENTELGRSKKRERTGAPLLGQEASVPLHQEVGTPGLERPSKLCAEADALIAEGQGPHRSFFRAVGSLAKA